MRRERWTLWVLRLLWAALALLAGPALGTALDGRSHPVQLVAEVALWGGWVAVLVALLVPTTTSLTALRLLAPGALLAVVVAAFAGGAGALALGVALGSTAAATVLALSADVGAVFIQGSAYGEERRLALRPPGPLVLGPLPLSWLVLSLVTGAGPLLLAAHAWVAGVVVTALAAAGLVVLVPRFHRLARRWLVLVPTGLVLHDPLVLAETAMFRRADIAGLRLAPAGTEALDLTGNALGLAVEVDLASTGLVVVAGTFRERQGKGIHVNSFLCSPSRPGLALDAAEVRGWRLPV